MPKGIYIHKVRPLADRLLDMVMPVTECGCWIFIGCLTNKGYGNFSIAAGKSRLAHRVSYELFRGQIPDGKHVLHRCDMPACINPDHLFLGTHLDNVADMIKKNRNTKGETVGNSKLTEADVLYIRLSPASGTSLSQLTGFSQGTISMVRNRRIWRHI